MSAAVVDLKLLSFCDDCGVLGVGFGPRDVPVLHRDPEKAGKTPTEVNFLGTC